LIKFQINEIDKRVDPTSYIYIVYASKDIARPVNGPIRGKQFLQGYFAKNQSNCRIHIAENGNGRTNMAFVEVKYGGKHGAIMADKAARECLVRSALVADGMRGVASIPFSAIADDDPEKCVRERRCLPSGLTIDERLFFVTTALDEDGWLAKLSLDKFMTKPKMIKFLEDYERQTHHISYWFRG
jgi:hypothetical protein